MLFFFVHLAARSLFRFLVGSSSVAALEVENAVLRHQLAVLRASLNPGAGPRTVKGSLTLGPFYLPPLLVALFCVAVAALAAARKTRRWVAIAGLVAVVLLIGSATTGWAPVSYRISHPTHPLGFVEDSLQLLGEAAAALVAALIASGRLRGRTHA